MKKRKKRIFTVFVALVILPIAISACQSQEAGKGQTELPPALAVLDAEKITAQNEICTNHVEGQITAWASREVENLEQVYTGEIVHFDGGPAFVGIDEVTRMAENMWIMFSKWEMKAGKTYISDNICLGEWKNWGLFGFKQEDPGIEYDWLEYNDDGIYFWRLFYDEKFQKEFNHPERIDAEFLDSFVNAWSDQNKNELVKIYNQDAQLEDTLFGVQKNGIDEIAAYSLSFFAQFQDAEWHLLDAFGEEDANNEQYPFTYQGGIMEIELPDSGSGNCTIRAAVLLAPDDEGKIISQKMFYNPQSLIDCGLAQ